MHLRRALFSIICCILANQLSAQFSLGAKISVTQSLVNRSEQLFDNSDNYVIYRIGLEKQQAFPSVGGVVHYKFKNAFLQSEVLFQYRRTIFDFENFVNDGEASRQISKGTSHIRFPIIGGFEFNRLKFGIGPIFSFQVSEQEVFRFLDDVDERFRVFEPAASILIGANFDYFGIDLSYEYHFQGVSEFIYYRNKLKGFSQQPYFLSLNFIYYFGYFY